MPKLICRCGFAHNLTPIPDDGWKTVRDKDYEAMLETDAQHSFLGLLYECPQCGRLMWEKPGEQKFATYKPEPDETTSG